MYKANIKNIVIWLLLITVVSFVIAGSIYLSKGSDGIIAESSGATSRSINEEKSFGTSGISTISVNTVSTDINVIPTDESEVRVHYYGDFKTSTRAEPPELYTDAGGSSISIQLKYKPNISIGFGFTNSNLKLDVYIPKSYTNDLKIETTSADLHISGLGLKNFEYRTVSGNLDSSDVTASGTTIKTTSGDAKLEGLKGGLDFTTVSGKLDAVYSEFKNNIDIKTTSGDTRITLPENSEFGVKFRSTSGDFSSKFPLTTSGTSSGKHSFDGTVGSGSYIISAETVSGDLNIYK